MSWPEGIYLHGTDKKFARFKPGPHTAIYFSDPNAIGQRGRRTQAEAIAEGPFGGWLAEVHIRGGKLFDPYNDPRAARIFDEVRDGDTGFGWGYELEDKRLSYTAMPEMVEAATPYGYTVFEVYEPAVQGSSIAVTDPSLLEIVGWHKVPRSNPLADFETGQPVRFRYMHNTEKSPYLGARYGQDIEPHGTYLLEDEAGGYKHPLPGWEYGWAEFESPLVLIFTTEPDEPHYGPGGWKQRLAGEYGKKGRALTQALLRDGYDGIVTYWDQGAGYTKEIVDLTFGEALEVDVVANPSDDDYLYHVTFVGSLSGIQAQGLGVGGGASRFGGGYGAHSAGKLFLTEPEGVFFWHSRMEETVTPLEAAEEVPIVLRFVPTAGEEDAMEDDELGTRDASAGAYEMREGVEPERLEVWVEDDWEPLEDIDPEEVIAMVEDAADVEREDDEEWYEYHPDMFMPVELHP